MPKKSHAKKHRPRRSKSEKRTERKLRQKQHQNVYVNVGKGGAPSSGAPIPPIVVSPPDQSQAFSSLFSSLERRLAPIASPYAVSAQLGMESKAPPKMEAPAQTPEVHATIENVPIMGASKADKAIKQTFGTQTDLNIGSPNPTVESIPNRSPDPIQSADFLTGKIATKPQTATTETQTQGRMNISKKLVNELQTYGKSIEHQYFSDAEATDFIKNEREKYGLTAEEFRNKYINVPNKSRGKYEMKEYEKMLQETQGQPAISRRPKNK